MQRLQAPLRLISCCQQSCALNSTCRVTDFAQHRFVRWASACNSVINQTSSDSKEKWLVHLTAQNQGRLWERCTRDCTTQADQTSRLRAAPGALARCGQGVELSKGKLMWTLGAEAELHGGQLFAEGTCHVCWSAHPSSKAQVVKPRSNATLTIKHRRLGTLCENTTG